MNVCEHQSLYDPQMLQEQRRSTTCSILVYIESVIRAVVILEGDSGMLRQVRAALLILMARPCQWKRGNRKETTKY